MHPYLRLTLLLGSTALLAIGCAKDYATEASTPVERELAALRVTTNAFLDTAAGINSGWSTRVTDCMADSALGGMGVHFADVARFDTTLDAQRPEVLVYAPQDGASSALRLVAVEYAVPLDAWTHTEPPMLLGQPLHVNAAFGLWVLHAWVQKPNPSGVFADWNPTVVCPSMPPGTALVRDGALGANCSPPSTTSLPCPST